VKRAGELFGARQTRRRRVRGCAEGDRRSAPLDRAAAGRVRFSCRAARHLPIAARRAMIAPEAGLSVSRQWRAARGLRAAASITGLGRNLPRNSSFWSGPRPDFHRPSRLRQPPAAGWRCLREEISVGRRARPAADAEARAVGGQAEAEHQQAASRAQGLPVPSARQDDRPSRTKCGAADITYIAMRQGFFVPGSDHRLGNPASALLAAVEHAQCGVLRGGAERGPWPGSASPASSILIRGHNSPATSLPRCCGIMGSRSAWMGAGAATTTSSSSACGGR